MKYFVTGVTGTVVPVIIENLLDSDPDPHFYFALRKGSGSEEVAARFERVVKAMDLDRSGREKLIQRSRLVEIDVASRGLGIEPSMYRELLQNVEKVLHGAADVRFDQPYERIRVPNVVFTEKMAAIFEAVNQQRRCEGLPEATFYYISTAYAYGICSKPIPEDYPAFHPGKPDNTYARTKAEAKRFMLEKIRKNNERIVIFEPTIIGGSAKTGRTRTYNLHYVVMMLAFLGKLPFLTAPGNTVDIVPVDWVAAVISGIMAKDQFHQGVLRLASGKEAPTLRYLRDRGHDYYVKSNPVAGHRIPKIRFVPRWTFFALILFQKTAYRSLYRATRRKRFRKLLKGIALLEGYFPYITGYKQFENEKSLAMIETCAGCGKAPPLQDLRDEKGRLVEKGYYDKVLADTLETGWGGLVDFKRLERKTAGLKSPRAAFSHSRR